MYNMTQNRLPAPYELNQVPDTGQYLAKGGRSHRGHKGMEKVHMNSHELNILDHLQGGSEHGPGGMKMYSHLEEILKNPHIIKSVHHHSRHHHAAGGIENLKRMGRFGDNEIAMIGPHTQHLFNQLAGGGATYNPQTGHPEYWSIGPALGGLWNSIKGVAGKALPMVKNAASSLFNSAKPAMQQIAQAAAPTILPMAQQALSDRFGSNGQMAGDFLQQGANRFLGAPSENQSPYFQAIGKGIGQAAKGYQSGASPSQAFGQGMEYTGSQIGGNVGNALQQSGQSLGKNGNWNQAARMGAERFYNDMGGREGLQNSVGRIGQGLMEGGFGGARDAAQNQMGQYMQRALPRPANRSTSYERPDMYEENSDPEYQDMMYA